MFTITKEFAFSASHVLAGLPEGHQCGRLHGHNYVVEVELAADVLDATGFVLDYGELAPFKRWVDDTLDHRHLNDVLPHLANPSAELLAQELYDVARRLPAQSTSSNWWLAAVRVRETPKTCAEYRP